MPKLPENDPFVKVGKLADEYRESPSWTDPEQGKGPIGQLLSNELKANRTLIEALKYPETRQAIWDQLKKQVFGIVEETVDAVKLPGDVASGKTDPNSDEAIRRATNLTGLLSLGGVGRAIAIKPSMEVGSFGGPLSITANMQKLTKAIDMQASGASRIQIWTETGWAKNPEGKWIYEISDNEIGFKRDLPSWFSKKESISFGELIDHPELFDAYPELKKLTVKQLSKSDIDRGVSASAYIDSEEIHLNPNAPKDELVLDVIHEMQHFIQKIEKRDTGASVSNMEPTVSELAGDRYDHIFKIVAQEMFPNRDISKLTKTEAEIFLHEVADEIAYQKYSRVYGEAEANNSMYRYGIPDDEKRLMPPDETDRIPWDEQTAGPHTAGRISESIKKIVVPRDEMGFYSKLDNEVANIQQKQATVAQWEGILKNAGIKDDEFSRIPFKNFDPNQVMTKEQFQQIIADNRYKIKEIIKATGINKNEFDRYVNDQMDYILRNDFGYKSWDEAPAEFVEAARKEATDYITERYGEPNNYNRSGQVKYADYSNFTADATNYRERLIILDPSTPAANGKVYRSSHWSEPNVIVHERITDNVIEGKPAVVAQEIQSDWHQTGRKQGYEEINAERIYDPRYKALDPVTQETLNDVNENFLNWAEDAIYEAKRDIRDNLTLTGDAHNAAIKDLNKLRGMVNKLIYPEDYWEPGGITYDDIVELKDNIVSGLEKTGLGQAYRELSETNFDQYLENFVDHQYRRLTDEMAIRRPNSGLPPHGPFEKTWPELGLKRLATEAVDNGKTRIGWIDGHENAARYGFRNEFKSFELTFQENPFVDRRGGGDYTLIATRPNGTQQILAYSTDKEKMKYNIRTNIGRGENSTATDKLVDALDFNVAKQTGSYKLNQEMAIGGSGMVGFYDEMLPRTAKKLFKAEPRYVEIGRDAKKDLNDIRGFIEEKSRYLWDEPDLSEYRNLGRIDLYGGKIDKDVSTKVEELRQKLIKDYGYPDTKGIHAWVLDIPPDMVEKIKKEGLPLYSSGIPFSIGGDGEE